MEITCRSRRNAFYPPPPPHWLHCQKVWILRRFCKNKLFSIHSRARARRERGTRGSVTFVICIDKYVVRFRDASSFSLTLSLPPSEGYFVTTLLRHRRVCLLPWRVIRKGCTPPTSERRDAIAPSARENLFIIVVVGPPLRPLPSSLAPAFRNATGRGCEGAIATRERETGWWKSGRSQIGPRPDRGQRTPTRRGTRGCPSVRHRRGWRGSRGPTGVALLAVREERYGIRRVG